MSGVDTLRVDGWVDLLLPGWLAHIFTTFVPMKEIKIHLFCFQWKSFSSFLWILYMCYRPVYSPTDLKWLQPCAIKSLCRGKGIFMKYCDKNEWSHFHHTRCKAVHIWGPEMKSKRGRTASEVRQLTDSLIVSRHWKEEPVHPNAEVLNPLAPTLLTDSIPLVHGSPDRAQSPILTYYNIRSLTQGAWAKGFARKEVSYDGKAFRDFMPALCLYGNVSKRTSGCGGQRRDTE